MPVPFRDAEDIDQLGAGAYLKVDADATGRVHRGALFFINARGEPLEFTYSRVETPNTLLWRKDDLRRHATRKLTTSLLSTASKTPTLLLCLADEVYHELFCNEIHLSVPVCRLASFLKATAHSGLETEATVDSPEPLNAFWFPGKPQDGSTEQRLFDRLAAHGLLLEPFERALTGLREALHDEEAEEG